MTFMYDIIYICQHGGIGRRTGLKIQRWQHRAGSTPAAGIFLYSDLRLISSLFYFKTFLENNKSPAILLYKVVGL